VVNDTSDPLEIVLSTAEPMRGAAGQSLRVTLENVGQSPMTVLKKFRPLPVFFAFKIERQDGTPILVPGAGKISIPQDAIQYVTLNEYESFGIRLRIDEIVRGGLEKGSYTISVVYHNQYGEKCFRGRIPSNTIKLKVP